MAEEPNGHTDTLRVLLENGADVEIKSERGFSALSIAIDQGQGKAHPPEMRQMLLDADAKEK